MSTWEAVLTKAAERDHRLFLTEKKNPRDGSFSIKSPKKNTSPITEGPKSPSQLPIEK